MDDLPLPGIDDPLDVIGRPDPVAAPPDPRVLAAVMAAMGPAARPAPRPAPRPAANQVQRRLPNPVNLNRHVPPEAFQIPAMQAMLLQRMGDEVEDAIDKENESRVRQARTERLFQHEKEMEVLRSQAMLERVRASQQASPFGMQPIPGFIDLTGQAQRIR